MTRNGRNAEEISKSAYKLADAMLCERGNYSEKPNSSPTLTDVEREAVETAALYMYCPILRNLLERLGGGK